MANTFTGLIKCSCGYNYRHIKERGIHKYFCSGYSKKLEGACQERRILPEQILLDIVQIYCNRNKIELTESNEFMRSIINIIEVDDNYNINIYYKNGENGIYHTDGVHI